MAEKIVYQLITRGGGIDGRDHMDKGGLVTAAFFERQCAENNPNRPWCEIVPLVVDISKQRREALAKLSPVDKLILGLK